MKVTLTTKKIVTAVYDIETLVDHDLYYQGTDYSMMETGKIRKIDDKYFIVWDDKAPQTELNEQNIKDILHKCWS